MYLQWERVNPHQHFAQLSIQRYFTIDIQTTIHARSDIRSIAEKFVVVCNEILVETGPRAPSY